MIGAAQIGDVHPEDMVLDEYQPIGDKSYDVTNLIQSCVAFLNFPCAGWTRKRLTLTDQEAVLKVSNCCLNNTQKIPYAHLGSVDKAQVCFGICSALASDFAPINEKGEGGLVPGCGCSNEMVDEIVMEMQSRKLKRGSVAQLKKLELLQAKVVKISTQLPILLHKHGIKQVWKLPEIDPPRSFDEKTFDVTNWCEMLFGCTFKELVLEPEEAKLRINTCFGMQSLTQKREYANLGSVEMQKQCICCRGVNSGLGQMNPQLGCANSVVSDIVQEMKMRMQERGEVGQIRKQEKILLQIAVLSEQMRTLCENQGVNYPPAPDELSRLYKQEQPPIGVIGGNLVEPSPVQPKEYDITDKWEALCGCLCTCCILGWTTKKAEMRADDVIITTKNNLDESQITLPYAEMGSVDATKFCCCCYSVNFASPGWGCNKAYVDELEQELQERKVKRGNIAQIKQLESLQGVSLELGVRSRLVLDKKGLVMPPSQETMLKLFGPVAPKFVQDGRQPHIAPSAKFEAASWGITDLCGACVGCVGSCGVCGWTTQHMDLTDEEMVITTKNFCLSNTTRTPYAQLGGVEVETVCCCCAELPEVARPGCGCSTELVQKIAEELQNRKVKRGNIAQLKMQENIMLEILKLGAVMDMLLDSEGVPPPFPPNQQVMGEVFGDKSMKFMELIENSKPKVFGTDITGNGRE